MEFFFGVRSCVAKSTVTSDMSSGVPFSVMDPAKSATGTNLVALKGGPGNGNLSDEFPQRVEIPTNVVAASLHFLGGVGMWAWPAVQCWRTM